MNAAVARPSLRAAAPSQGFWRPAARAGGDSGGAGFPRQRRGGATARNGRRSNDVRITRVENAPLNGARLDAYPEACLLQLPGLHAAASDQSRAAALQGLGYLYPLLASGFATLDDAKKKHDRLFGFYPVHPGEGEWLWDGNRLSSSKYGSVFRQRQPGYEEGDRDFGILKDLDHLHVGMQFEESGLRTTVRWKLRK